MPRKLTELTPEDGARLMAVYRESNGGNAAWFAPDAPTPEEGLQQTEVGFLTWLRENFLPSKENALRVREEDGVFLSALRLTEIEDFLWLEAPETRRTAGGWAMEKGCCGLLRRSLPMRAGPVSGAASARGASLPWHSTERWASPWNGTLAGISAPERRTPGALGCCGITPANVKRKRSAPRWGSAPSLSFSGKAAQ